MKTIITNAGEFVRAVEVNPIAAQAGSFQLLVSSQLRSARNPDEWQSNFNVILQRSELTALRDVIQVALNEGCEIESA